MEPNPLCPVTTLTIGTCHESRAWQFSASCWGGARFRPADINGSLCRFLGEGTTGSQHNSCSLFSKDPAIPWRGEIEARIDSYFVFDLTEILDPIFSQAQIPVLPLQLPTVHAYIKCIAPLKRMGKLRTLDFKQS